MFRLFSLRGVSAVSLTAAALTGAAAVAVGLAPSGGPAAAAAAAPADPVITITAGGDRTADTSVSGLDGVRFDFYAGVAGTPPSGSPAASCVTGTGGVTGKCSAGVPVRSGGTGGSRAGYWIIQSGVPAGWFGDPVLNTGGASSIQATDYSKIFVPDVTGNIAVPMATTTSTQTRTARGSVWAASRANPVLPGKCGLKVALLFDLSGSIGSNIGQLRSAGTSFVTALTGTPSSVGVYTFASKAPANTANNSNLPLTPVSTAQSAAAVTSKINGLTVQSGSSAGTNWDQGLWQVAADPTQYDAAIVLTDGNPTYYGPGASGPGSFTRFIEVENGIFSANSVKARGTTVLSVGIGDVGASTANLAAISGPRAGTDYFSTDFSQLASLLRTLAEKNCLGTVNVVKKVVPASAPGDLNAAAPAPGWEFSAVPGSVTPASAVTGASGAVSFATATSSAQPVTITETEQGGYQLITQGGKNAGCQTSAGRPVTVTNAASPPGFTVDALASQIVTCVVYNQEEARPDPASVVVTKSWNIDGMPLAQGDQDPDFQAGLSLDPVHPPGTLPSWGQEYGGYLAGQDVSVAENVTVPPGCTGQASGDLGSHTLAARLNSYHLTNTVTCATQLTLIKQISNPFPGATPVPLSSWALTATPAGGGPAAVSGATGVTGAVTGGTSYALAESSVPGYTQQVVPGATLAPGATGSWHCVQVIGGRSGLEDFTGADGTVVVPYGEHVACTAVNDADPATLTLVKHVVNDHGGTARPTDWTLSATPDSPTMPPAPDLDGVTGSPGVTGVAIPAGVPYTLAENGPSGYSLTSLECAITGTSRVVPTPRGLLTAAIGQDLTCTFTNAQQPPVPPTPKPTPPKPTPPTPKPTPPTPTPPTPTPRPSPTPTTTTPQPGPTTTSRTPGPGPTFPMPVGGAPTGGGSTAGHSAGPLVAGSLSLATLGGIAGAGAMRRRRRAGSGS